METITKINHLDEVKIGWQEYAGYEIVTTEQIIYLLIENRQQCCEDFGYFLSEESDETIQSFVGAEIFDIKVTDTARNVKKIKELEEDYLDWEVANTMLIDLETNKGVLQFAAYNEHNGYYGHDVKIVSKQLDVDECL
ncbi:hypothetical protein CN527_02375 [Bacillus cereus]|nr:hypothetical protein CN527_02375 [Bacillus cereus]